MTTFNSATYGSISAVIAGCFLASSVAASTLTLDDAVEFRTGNDPFGGNEGFLEVGGFSSPSLAKCDDGTESDDSFSKDCGDWEPGVADGDYSEAFELTYTDVLSFTWAFDATDVSGIDLEDVLYPKFVAVKSGIQGGQGSGYYIFDVTGHVSGSISVAGTDSAFESISHVSFYDTGDMTPIPLPAAGWLLLGGLGGLISMKRRRRTS